MAHPEPKHDGVFGVWPYFQGGPKMWFLFFFLEISTIKTPRKSAWLKPLHILNMKPLVLACVNSAVTCCEELKAGLSKRNAVYPHYLPGNALNTHIIQSICVDSLGEWSKFRRMPQFLGCIIYSVSI